jgi:hypothetical protein
MVSPAGTDANIAGVEVVIGVSSGSGVVATTGGITRSRGASEWNSVVPMYPSITALAIVAAMALRRRLC